MTPETGMLPGTLLLRAFSGNDFREMFYSYFSRSLGHRRTINRSVHISLMESAG